MENTGEKRGRVHQCISLFSPETALMWWEKEFLKHKQQRPTRKEDVAAIKFRKLETGEPRQAGRKFC